MNLEKYKLPDEQLNPSEDIKNKLHFLAKGETSIEWVIQCIAYENKLNVLTQLEAVKPAIEEAKKEERERIFYKIEEMYPMFEYLHGVILTPSQYQILKEGK